jgi:hypothetical protein
LDVTDVSTSVARDRKAPTVVPAFGMCWNGCAVPVPLRDVLLEHVRRLDHMIVDADEDGIVSSHVVRPPHGVAMARP